MNKIANFEFDQFYHVFNRTNNKEKLFRNNENRKYFLRRYGFYLKPFVDVHAYALLGNHFHFSIKVKSEEEISTYLKTLPSNQYTVVIRNYLNSNKPDDQINNLIIAQHHRFFISYSQAFNNMYSRQGNLFNKQFKRSHFLLEHKFRYLQYYIHHNARKHRLVSHFRDHKHHSYFDIVESNNQLINTDFVINQFGSLEAFKDFHMSPHYSDKFEKLTIE